MSELKFERVQVETPIGEKLVKPGSGPMKLQAHDADYKQMFSKFSLTGRRRFIQQMIEIAAAVPNRDLDDLYMIDSQVDTVTSLKSFDEWSDTYGRKIRTGESATFLWERTTAPVCPCCDQTLYWHSQAGCDHEGDIGSWERRETIQPEALFDYSQTTSTNSPGDTQPSHKPWRVAFLSRDVEERAAAVLGALDTFESNVGYTIEFEQPHEWRSPVVPASVDQNAALLGSPTISVLDDDSLQQKAQHVFYGLAVGVYAHAPETEQTKLSTLLLTELLCKHYGIPSIDTPHESYFEEDSDFSLDIVDDVLKQYSTITAGVEHRL